MNSAGSWSSALQGLQGVVNFQDFGFVGPKRGLKHGASGALDCAFIVSRFRF